jgi:hypothetical protein
MKSLSELVLVCPVHLTMTNNGHGEFPDSYKLTKAGINLILESINLEIIKAECELAEEPKEYSDEMILNSVKALLNQIE